MEGNFKKGLLVLFVLGLALGALFSSVPTAAAAQEMARTMDVFVDRSQVVSGGWPAGAILTLWNNHVNIGSGGVDGSGTFRWQNTNVKFNSGDLVELTYLGLGTISHTVFNFTIDTHPVEVNAIGGRAFSTNPFHILVDSHGGAVGDMQEAHLLPGGYWIATGFTTPIHPGTQITVAQSDADGSRTLRDAAVYGSKVDIYPVRNVLEGWGLNLGNSKTILDTFTLKDVVLPVEPSGHVLYTAPIPNSFPRGSIVQLSMEMLGMKIPFKTVSVDYSLAVSGFNFETKILRGIGTPGTFVVLQTPEFSRITLVDQYGGWSISLHDVPERNWSQLAGRVFVSNEFDDYTVINFQFFRNFLPLILKP